MIPIVFDDEAASEVEDAALWYQERGPDLRERFIAEIDHVISGTTR